LPRLPGRHQYANAAAAIRAVKAAGFIVTEAMMEKAMNKVEWPGRLQRLTEGRLMAHAPAGASHPDRRFALSRRRRARR
jgi:dihydrofolate synthase/folylpolyglutamate synthase